MFPFISTYSQALQYLRKLCNHPSLVLTPQHPEYKRVIEQLAGQNSNLRDIQHAPKLSALKQVMGWNVSCYINYTMSVCIWTMKRDTKCPFFIGTSTEPEAESLGRQRKSITTIHVIFSPFYTDVGRYRHNRDPSLRMPLFIASRRSTIKKGVMSLV